jgi:surface protein
VEYKMATNTQTVTGFIVKPNGDPFTSGTIRFTLGEVDTDGNEVISQSNKVEFPIASDGAVTAELWPNTRGSTGSVYLVQVREAADGALETIGRIQVPDAGPYDLATLMRAFVPEAASTFFTALTEDEFNAKIALMDERVAATAADRVQTGLDRTQTVADASATAADRVQTGLDRIATAADLVETAQDVIDANTAKDAAAVSFDSFDVRYLGAKASAPTLDNAGNALITGAQYFNSVSDLPFIWTGSAWSQAIFDTAGALLAANNFSDVDDADIAATNLRLGDGINDDGTKTSGTYTPSATVGSRIKKIVNNGGFSIVPPTLANNTSAKITLLIENAGSAGEILTSAFDNVTGDAFTTTDQDTFICQIDAFKTSGPQHSSLNVLDSTILEFIMTAATTAPSETFTIPCQNVGTFNAVVSWGDGTTSVITAYNDADLVHTYASAGDHRIKISGTFPNITFNNAGDRLKVKSVENLGVVGWQRLNSAFYGCDNMLSFVSGNTDTSSVTSMVEMFRDCSSLTSLDVSSFDTSSVTSMAIMFFGCSSLTSIDATSFNTSSVAAMNNMFESCSSLTSLDVTSFNTSNVTLMRQMFEACSFLTSLDVSSFDTSSVTSMIEMFRDCSSLTSLDVSSFDTSSVTSMAIMFFGCSSLTDIVGVEDFSIEALNITGGLNSFATGVTLPTARYDSLLVNWDAQNPFDGMSPNFGSSKYTAGGAAATARANLISTDGWTITDGGTA